MTVVRCDRISCLHHGLEVCTANRIEWCEGKCDSYITAHQAMKANAPPVERRNGAIIPKQCRPIR